MLLLWDWECASALPAFLICTYRLRHLLSLSVKPACYGLLFWVTWPGSLGKQDSFGRTEKLLMTVIS